MKQGLSRTAIFKNQYKEQGDNKPDYKGIITFNEDVTFKAGDNLDLSLWVTDKEKKPDAKSVMSGQGNLPYKKEGVAQQATGGYQVPQAPDDTLPF